MRNWRQCDSRGRDWSDVATNLGVPTVTPSWKGKEQSPVKPLEEGQFCQHILVQ